MKMPFVDVTRPYFLILLIVIPYIYFVHKRNIYPLTAKGNRWQLFVRCLLIVSLVLGLAGLRMLSKLSRQCVIFVLDVSPSMPRPDIARALSWVEGKIDASLPEDIAGLVVVDSKARLVADPRSYKRHRFRKRLKGLAPKLKALSGEWITDLGAGLELAGRLFPSDYLKRVVLISDGNQNGADILPQLLRLRDENIKTDVLAWGGRADKPDVWIEGIYVQSRVGLGQEFGLEIKLGSNLMLEAQLKLFLNNELLSQKRVQLKGAGVQLIRDHLLINKPGDYLISAEVSAPDDAQPENNYGACWVNIFHESHLLYISGSPLSPSPLQKQLARWFSIDAIFPAELGTNPMRYQQYMAIILENVSAFALTSSQMNMLEEWVHHLGKGIVVIGGDKAYGAGGYMDTPLEKLLPVEMQAEDKNRKTSLGIILVLDKSKSMGGLVEGRTKLEIAIDAAIASLSWLKQQDLVGVVAFDTKARPVIPIAGKVNKSQVSERLKSINFGGKTNIYPGLDLAYKWLTKSAADIKHVLLLSDGRTEKGNFTDLLDKFAAAKITVSAVGIGPDCDRQLLNLISQRGKGRLFLTDDYYQLKRIFFKDLQIASQSLLRRGVTRPKLNREHEILEGIAEPLPVMSGYVATTAKSDAQQLILSAEGEPVLTVWNYGLGKAVAFTGDSDKWIRDWLAWPYFSKLGHQIVRWAGRSLPVTEALTPRIELSGNTARLWVDVLDKQGQFKNNLKLQARVVYPGLNIRQVDLIQSNPGLYQAEIPVRAKGSYTVEVLQMESGEVTGSAASGFVVQYLPEAKDIQINHQLLHKIASVTRGRILQDDGNPFIRADDEQYKYTGLDEFCLLLALLLFLVEVLGRKLYYFKRKKAY
jgi:Ca-activated chloride channel family protein